MSAIHDNLSPARMGDGYVYWVEIAGFEKPLTGLADTRSLEDLHAAFHENGLAYLRFSGITVPGEKTSTGRPIHVGSGLLSVPDTPCLIRYDDAFSGLPGGGDEDGEVDERDEPGPSSPGGPKPILPLGPLKRS